MSLANTSRTTFVAAIWFSVLTLIFAVPKEIERWISFVGIPVPPCNTNGRSAKFEISSISLKPKFGSPLYGPCTEPNAGAKQSIAVSATILRHSSGSA